MHSHNKLLKTPTGEPAGDTDRIMLLAMWTKHLNARGHVIVSAGMGKPTLPINERATSQAVAAWSAIHNKASEAHHFFREHDNDSDTRDKVAQLGNDGAVIGYDHPQGNAAARNIMSQALTNWYNKRVAIKPEHILFTVGGAGAINTVFKVVNDLNPNTWIVTPFPHYSLHATSDQRTRLHPIQVMKEPGYRLTRAALVKSLKVATKRDRKIGAFLFCDPNNPLGTVVSEGEWRDIADLLRQHKDIPIILDEAYAEMRLDGHSYRSLLEVAPDLQDRIILMRSATKALSAAGERMAVAVTSNKAWMSKLLSENIRTVGHAPVINQGVFATVLNTFGRETRKEIANFYGPQVRLAEKRLKKMGAAMPDPDYRVDGTFYIAADLSDLIGMDIPKEAEEALGKSGKVETDEDIIYYLLFNGLMVAPFSYFGGDPNAGYVRITCSGGDSEITSICDLLEGHLTKARKEKQKLLEERISGIKRFLDVDRRELAALEDRYSLLKREPRNSSPSLKPLMMPFSLPKSISLESLSQRPPSPVESSRASSSGFSPPQKTVLESKKSPASGNSSASNSPRDDKSPERANDKTPSPQLGSMTEALQLKNYIDTQMQFIRDAEDLKAAAKEKKEVEKRKGIFREYKLKNIPEEQLRKQVRLVESTYISNVTKRAVKEHVKKYHTMFRNWVERDSTIPAPLREQFAKLTAHQRSSYQPWLDYLRKVASQEGETPGNTSPRRDQK